MSDGRHERIRDIFLAACTLAGEARRRHLDEACGDDGDLRREVLSLLEHDEQDDALLATLEDGGPDLGAVAADIAAVAADAVSGLADGPLPEQLGPYRVLGLLGEGGMGLVYRAEQDSPHREVALKVVRTALAGPRLLSRFEHEAETLGRLQHPGIAQIFEAGVAETASGSVPYFAMELVDGTTLTEFAAHHDLGTRRRLELIARIADAVHHAHTKGVVHRDLKPGNILIDATGQPKVLDFGVARVTDADLQAATLRTDVGQIVGTLPYMSPEQVKGDGEAVDARSDVYALGVVTYELLAGRLPYDLGHGGVIEGARVIQEAEPTPLSAVHKVFRGDVETIVGKALSKEPERRYASASELAADIRRYLADEPVAARPPSATYQFGKFARRHRALVNGVATVFVLLVVSLAVTWWLLMQSQRNLDKAETTQAYMSNIFRSADPNRRGRDARVVDMLDDAAAGIDHRLADKPEVAAFVKRSIGMTYFGLGLGDEALVLLRESHALYLTVLGLDDLETVAAENDLATVLAAQGDVVEAEAMLRHALQVRRDELGLDAPETLLTQGNLGGLLLDRGAFDEAEVLLRDREVREIALGGLSHHSLEARAGTARLLAARGRHAEAEAAFRALLDDRLEVSGLGHEATLSARTNLAMVLLESGNPGGALPLLDQDLAWYRERGGEDHPDTLATRSRRALVLRHVGRRTESLSELRDVYARQQGREGARAGTTLATGHRLGVVLLEVGEVDEAEAVLVDTVEGMRATLGPTHADTLNGMSMLAQTWLRQKRTTDAETLLDELCSPETQAALPPGHDTQLLSLHALAQLRRSQERTDDAELLLRQLLQLCREHRTPTHDYTLATLNNLGNLLLDADRVAEAEPLLGEAADGQVATRGEASANAVVARNNHALALDRLGRDAEAEAAWARVVAGREATVGAEHEKTFVARSRHAAALGRISRYDEGESEARAACEGLARLAGAEAPETLRARERLADLYDAWGRPEDAAAWRP